MQNTFMSTDGQICHIVFDLLLLLFLWNWSHIVCMPFEGIYFYVHILFASHLNQCACVERLFLLSRNFFLVICHWWWWRFIATNGIPLRRECKEFGTIARVFSTKKKPSSHAHAFVCDKVNAKMVKVITNSPIGD